MKKFFTIPFLALILLAPAAIVRADAAAPAASVWAVPSDAKKGDDVQLNALVYNATLKTVTVTVLFSTDTEDIATIDLILPEQTAKTATTDWMVPASQTTVTASVIKAVDASQKTVPEMLGPISTVVVGAASTGFSFGSIGGITSGAKGWFGGITAVLEPWRKQEAGHFAALRDQKRVELGFGTLIDGTTRYELQPDKPGASGISAPATDAATQGLAFGKYVVMWVASALATIFGSATIFYITLALLILFILRFLFRLFL